MRLRNDKGVTLLALTITIIVLLIITSIVINNSKSQLVIKRLNNLFSDIDSINTKVTDYYLKNNSLPIFKENTYFNSSSEFNSFISSKYGSATTINVNDDGPYYVLNLAKLENLTLNYGIEYKEWTDTSTFNSYQDLYIINAVTHQVYYPYGIKYGDEIFFTKESSATLVEKITPSAVADEIAITKVTASKNIIGDEGNVVINADITLSIGENYKTETLQYAWKISGDTGEIEYSPFDVTDKNTANLTSKIMENQTNYVLYIKILDTNGVEHIINQEIETS